MKIALVAPPLLKTPPTGYGGLEQVVYDLGCALTAGGDDVTLFAPPGSHIDGGKVFETVEAPERTDVNWVDLEGNAYNKYVTELSAFDIVHDHSWFGFPFLAKMSIPELKLCHTHHGHLDWVPSKMPPQLGKLNLIGISDFMRKEYEMQGWGARYVYNGIDINKYKYSGKKGDRLVFVGRISEFKHSDIAIQVAIETKTPIDIIGGSFVDNKPYLESVKTMCDNSNGIATLHLDLPMDKKIEFVRSAKANLIPSAFGEPFGLVAVEALACGTPVITFDDGALREIMGKDGDVGYVCSTKGEMVKIVGNIDKTKHKISPIHCRKRAEFFSRENMAKNYRILYEKIIKGEEW